MEINRKPGDILIIDDDRDILLTARVVLKKQFGNIQTETDPARIIPRIQEGSFDVILLDMNFSAGATSGREGINANGTQFEGASTQVFWERKDRPCSRFQRYGERNDTWT